MHRRLFTEGLQRVLEDPVYGPWVDAILDSLQEESPCREDIEGCVTAWSSSCRQCTIRPGFPTPPGGVEFREQWEGSNNGPEIQNPDSAIDDRLEILGNEAYITDNFADWKLDADGPSGDTPYGYGVLGQSLAGFGHFCPGGCDTSATPGTAAGWNCPFVAEYAGSTRWRMTYRERFYGSDARIGSAWDGYGYQGLPYLPPTITEDLYSDSLDYFLCAGYDLADTVLYFYSPTWGTSPGGAYVTADEAARMSLHFDNGDHPDSHIGFDSDSTKYPPVEYMARYFLERWELRRALRYLGPVGHGVADAGQPMHVAGYMGNYHDWLELALQFLTRGETWDEHWGRGRTCAEHYGTAADRSGAAECMHRWAVDLAHQAIDRASAGESLPGNTTLQDRVIGLQYVIAGLTRDASGRTCTYAGSRCTEADYVREQLDAYLMARFPWGTDYCDYQLDRMEWPQIAATTPEWYPDEAGWDLEDGTRGVRCRGAFYYSMVQEADYLWSTILCPLGAFPPRICPLPPAPRAAWDTDLDSTMRPGYRSLFEGRFRICTGECGDWCRAKCTELDAIGAACPWAGDCDASCAELCENDVDGEMLELDPIKAQILEETDRAVAGTLALLYLLAAEVDPLPDRDGDGLPDAYDPCPDWGGVTTWEDEDGDGIPNTCDLCPYRPRPDAWGTTFDESVQYNRTVGRDRRQDANAPFDGIAPLPSADSDGDDVGDACDLCPYVPSLESLDPAYEDADFLRLRDAEVPGVRVTYDADLDDVGNRCDNCRVVWNPDQVNCNENEERSRWAAGWDGWESQPSFVGTGDACDATLCLAECAKLSGQWTSSIKADTDECVEGIPCGWWEPEHHLVCRYECHSGEPAEVAVCPAGFYDTAAARDYDRAEHATASDFANSAHSSNSAVTFRTEFRGCPCRPEERAAGTDECAWLWCPTGGREGSPTRWSHATNDHRMLVGTPGGSWTAPPLPWEYRRTYALLDGSEPGTAGAGVRYEPGVSGPYRAWYRIGGRRYFLLATELWNYLSDAEQVLWPADYADRCVDVGGVPDCRVFPRESMRDEHIWFKPRPGAGYGGFDADLFGNSYIERRSMSGDPHRHDVGTPEPFRPLPEPGEPLLPIDDERVFDAVGPYSPLAGLIGPMVAGDPRYLFDQPGEVAGGLVVAKWNADSEQYTDVVGSKLVSGSFDVRSPSIAFAGDSTGKVTTYWMFGGLDAAGAANDGFWVGRRTIVEGPDGLPIDSFALSEIPRSSNGLWPGARWNAVLVRAPAASGGRPPNVDEGVLGATSSESVTTPYPTGRLVLVGGEDSSGPLADIWLYDGTWRRASDLPDVNRGLTAAGGTIIAGELWLYGGRQGSGTSADLWRIDLLTGLGQRLGPDGGAWPSARERPALAHDASTGSLLMYGGTTAGAGNADLWGYSPETAEWRQKAVACTGTGCPEATGQERLVPSGTPDAVTVVANPYGSRAGEGSWTLDAGGWASRTERRALPGRDDCNVDGVREAGWGARCDVGGEGFPAYGRLRCDPATQDLVCRAPSSPARVIAEYTLPGNGPVAAVPGGVAVLQGRDLDLYNVADDGGVSGRSSFRLARPGIDLAAALGHAFVADREGLTIYGLTDGEQVAALPTCGKARRVFVDRGIVYVLGLRSVLVVDAGDPTAPLVLSDYRIITTTDSAWLIRSAECGPIYRVADALCDATGVCGLTGRVAAAESNQRLFVNFLGSTYVIDFRDRSGPVVSASLRTGLASHLAYEAPVLYVDGVGCGRAMYEDDGSGLWSWAGSQDVNEWVRGIVPLGPQAILRRAGRLVVAENQ